MKRHFHNGIFYFLLGTSLISEGKVLAQRQWMPESITMLVPIEMTYGYSAYCPECNVIYDSSHVSPGKIYPYLADFPEITNYFDSNDTVSIGYSGGSKTATIHFGIDKAKKQLTNFYIGFSDQRPFHPPENMNAYSLEYHLQLSSTEYSLINDSILVVNLRPDARKNIVTSADYHYSFKRIVNASDQEYLDGESRSMVSLPDSSVDSCSLRFIYRTPASNVPSIRSKPISLSVSMILSNAGTRFKLPELEVMQHLHVYDLLGRPIRQFEIPSGTSEYTISQSQLPSGYYLARLGNMTAKFVVN